MTDFFFLKRRSWLIKKILGKLWPKKLLSFSYVKRWHFWSYFYGSELKFQLTCCWSDQIACKLSLAFFWSMVILSLFGKQFSTHSTIRFLINDPPFYILHFLNLNNIFCNHNSWHLATIRLYIYIYISIAYETKYLIT